MLYRKYFKLCQRKFREYVTITLIINTVDVWRLELGYLCTSHLFGYHYSRNSYPLVEHKVEK